MFAVVVRESGDAEQIEQSGQLVSDRVAPRVRRARGFISAMWMSDGSGGTLNVIAFESEDHALAALEAARTSTRPPFMKLETVELFRVLASA
jgi:outer membrane cobalamin receptor